MKDTSHERRGHSMLHLLTGLGHEDTKTADLRAPNRHAATTPRFLHVHLVTRSPCHPLTGFGHEDTKARRLPIICDAAINYRLHLLTRSHRDQAKTGRAIPGVDPPYGEHSIAK